MLFVKFIKPFRAQLRNRHTAREPVVPPDGCNIISHKMSVRERGGNRWRATRGGEDTKFSIGKIKKTTDQVM